MSARPHSFRLDFHYADSEKPILSNIRACLTTPLPSSDRGPRSEMTGFWYQLEANDGTVLYRRDDPGLMLPRHREMDRDYPRHLVNAANELLHFEALVPNIPGACGLAIFAPPRDAQGKRPHLGAASELVQRFKIDFSKHIAHLPKLNVVNLPQDICGNGRGQVLSIVNVINHGRVESIYNLVILAEGYLSSQQDKFMDEANTCIDYLLSRKPFNLSLGNQALNIFVVKVASKAEGINGTTASPTYFNAQNSKGTLITWDQSCVKAVCDALFQVNDMPYWNWAGLICQAATPKVGTSVGGQFMSGLYTDYELIFQHEFGHSGFLLADEYSGTLGSFTGAEPAAANQTTQTTASLLKWSKLLTPGVAIPTLGNPSDCGRADTRSNPVKDSDIGLYAGGSQFSCGVFHPQYSCVMNSEVDANGEFCAVCLQAATTIVASVFANQVPAPGAVYYSPITGQWSQASVAVNSITRAPKSPLQNYSQFQSVITELKSGTVGPATQQAFSDAGQPLPAAQFEIFQAYYDIGQSHGLWYLINNSNGATEYVRTYLITSDSFIQIGGIAIPEFPQMPMFESVLVGTQVALFSSQGGKLAFGTLDGQGNIVSGRLVEQTVGNLNNQITSLSVSLIASRIWVAVVDSLQVKIAAYQLTTGNWAQPGFSSMPVANPVDFKIVRQFGSGNLIYIVALTSTGLMYSSFNLLTQQWLAQPVVTPITGNIAEFDIASDGNSIFLITVGSEQVNFYTSPLAGNNWSEGTEISANLGLRPDDSIVSLTVAVLRNVLHIVALIDQQPRHAMYDHLAAKWIQPLMAIVPLKSLAVQTAAFSLHSTDTQLYLAMSEIDNYA